MTDYEIRFVNDGKLYQYWGGLRFGKHFVFVDGKKINIDCDNNLQYDHNVTIEEELHDRIQRGLNNGME